MDKKENEVDIFWGARDPHEAKALRCLVDAEAYLGKAMLLGSIELYSKALESSEKVTQYFPWCLLAHYISAVARLTALGDEKYARQKHQLLQSVGSEDANTLAEKLYDEIKRSKGMS